MIRLLNCRNHFNHLEQFCDDVEDIAYSYTYRATVVLSRVVYSDQVIAFYVCSETPRSQAGPLHNHDSPLSPDILSAGYMWRSRILSRGCSETIFRNLFQNISLAISTVQLWCVVYVVTYADFLQLPFVTVFHRWMILWETISSSSTRKIRHTYVTIFRYCNNLISCTDVNVLLLNRVYFHIHWYTLLCFTITHVRHNVPHISGIRQCFRGTSYNGGIDSHT